MLARVATVLMMAYEKPLLVVNEFQISRPIVFRTTSGPKLS